MSTTARTLVPTRRVADVRRTDVRHADTRGTQARPADARSSAARCGGTLLRPVPADCAPGERGDAVRRGDVTTRAAVPTGRLVLTRRGRRVVVGAVVALGVLLGAFLGLGAAADARADVTVVPVAVVQHVVQPGETLWQIAAAMTPADEDVRDTIARLVRLNDLPSAELMAGQTLQLPAAG